MLVKISDLPKVAGFRVIPDFPKSGIQFIDIMPALSEPYGVGNLVDLIFDKECLCFDDSFDTIVAPESRGFILGSVLASECGSGFVPARKPGKLPPPVLTQDYTLEYGVDSLCIEKSALKKGQKVLIVDDVLATGGTVEALVNLIHQAGAEVIGVFTLIDLCSLHKELSIPCKSLYQVS